MIGERRLVESHAAALSTIAVWASIVLVAAVVAQSGDRGKGGHAMTKAEVRMLGGAPCLFINGRPHTGLVYECRPHAHPPVVEDGRLELKDSPVHRAATREIACTKSFAGDYVAEARVCVDVRRHVVACTE